MTDLETAWIEIEAQHGYSQRENAAMIGDHPNRVTPLSVEECADVLAFIRENGPLTVNAIGMKCHRTRSWATRRVNCLEQHGKVRRRVCNDRAGSGRNGNYYLIEAVK